MPSNGKSWIGVDLDGTLAKWAGDEHCYDIGKPVPSMVARVKDMLRSGKQVKIFTARVSPINRSDKELLEIDDQREMIRDWCKKFIGRELPITYEKDPEMVELYDDRVVHVERNTGKILG